MKQIPLTQGQYAIVDDEDYEWLNQWKWCAVRDHRTFYAMRTDRTSGRKTNIRMHRQILNVPKGKITDHKNRKGYDNRKHNLRICTYSQSAFNRRSNKNSRSKYKGIHWRKDRKKWSTQIIYNSKTINLGHFISEIEAAKAYDHKAKELFGEFANLNFKSFRSCERIRLAEAR